MHLGAALESAAPPAQVFAVLTDWPRHAEWMVLTRAEVRRGDGRGPGSVIAAFSGLGPIGFLDTMEITTWEPPHLVIMRHTGRVVRGRGAIRVRPWGGGGSRIVWAEELDLPFGPLGRLAWPLVRPLMRRLVLLSLRRLLRLAGRGVGG
ncbi:SRPBCC family protein [Nonomuraea sp. NPDC050310]|uniref:SRPBCC family protein n=1 Tax=unclassified Nonomuraea TaxID=2593643 RepID=UPI0033D64461